MRQDLWDFLNLFFYPFLLHAVHYIHNLEYYRKYFIYFITASSKESMSGKCCISISDIFVNSDFNLHFACYLFSGLIGYTITTRACSGFLSAIAVEKVSGMPETNWN